MNKEYDIVYCKDCNEVKITQDDKTCLGCGNQSSVIGFKHDVIQDILDIETMGENNG
jgi:hypothetical protein